MRLRRLLLPPALLVLAIGCGGREEESELTPEQQATVEQAMATLELAPEVIRVEVLRTCDKWKHALKECVDEEVRMAQLECWNEVGYPYLKGFVELGVRERRRDRGTMMHHNVCMTRRLWRFREPSGYF